MSDDRVFLDTNIFIYMYTTSEPRKKETCLDLLDTRSCITSTQAINEISNVLTRKMKTPFNDLLQILNDVYNICEVKQIQRRTIFQALNLNKRYGFSYYDCLMLSSALESDCKVIYTEDMNDGQIIESKLQIVNPFQR